jgi:hypothetical protein
MSIVLKLTGQRFGSLVVLSRVPNKNGRVTWLCVCDCGKEKEVTAQRLRNGTTLSCGCRHWGKKKYEHIYNRLVASAAKRSISLNLSFSEFRTFVGENCHYCGTKIDWLERCAHKPHKGSDAYNIDRKDNTLGYFLRNCVACCYVCNVTKSNRFTYEEFLIIGHAIRTVLWRRK